MEPFVTLAVNVILSPAWAGFSLLVRLREVGCAVIETGPESLAKKLASPE